MTADRRTLVTGGAGFIGSHLVEALLARGDAVVVIDDLSTGRFENLAPCLDAIEMHEARVSDAIGAVDGTFDEIYHLAAAVGVQLVVDDPIGVIERNVMETAVVLAGADRLGAPPLLIASTSEVYGKSPHLPLREDGDLLLGPTTSSRWSYGCSKAVDEHLALAWHRSRQLPVCIARLFNTVGPRQRGCWGMVLPRFVSAALAGKPLVVYGDGSQTRCFCDVRDVVPMLIDLLGSPGSAGSVVNVGHDEAISMNDLAMLVIETTASDSAIEHVSHEEVYGEGFEDLQDRRPDLNRLRAAVGDGHRRPLAKTIRDLAAASREDQPC